MYQQIITSSVFHQVLMSLLLFSLAWNIWRVKQKKELAGPIARERKIGAVLVTLAYAYSGYEGAVLLGADFPLISKIIPFAFPLLCIGSVLGLDYLYTRAWGTVVIICGLNLLSLSFAAALPGRAMLSSAVYLLAIVSLFFIGQPWHMRNLLEKVAENDLQRKLALSVLAGCLILINLPFFL